MDDFESLANEYINLKSSTLQIRVERELSKSMKGEVFVLMYLKKYGGVAYPKDISKAMCATTARVAVVINHLEAKHFVTRSVDPKDTRQTIITITDEGKCEVEKYLLKFKKYLVHFFERLGVEDTKEYLRLQKKIAEIESDELF